MAALAVGLACMAIETLAVVAYVLIADYLASRRTRP